MALWVHGFNIFAWATTREHVPQQGRNPCA